MIERKTYQKIKSFNLNDKINCSNYEKIIIDVTEIVWSQSKTVLQFASYFRRFETLLIWLYTAACTLENDLTSAACAITLVPSRAS